MATLSPSPHADPTNPNTVLTVPFLSKPSTPINQKNTTLSLAFLEARSILGVAVPMAATGLILYCRSMISMLFLGHLGRLPLAGGALAIGFANITGYSVLSGLAMGMEPICGQAFGANRTSLLRLALHRTILLLLAASIPIALLWCNMQHLLLACGQDGAIAAAAHSYIVASLPDLLLNSLLHPIRIYLRAQSITLPLTYCAAASLFLHLPINYLLVTHLRMGIHGVALAAILTNLNLLILLISYIYFSGVHHRTGGLAPTAESFTGFRQLLALSIPSCISVCLEWWWYEIMILLCGVLLNPQATVASMGILIQTTSLIYIFPSSLSFGVSTRVANQLGAGRPDSARRASTVGLSCGFALGLVALGFAFSVRNVWAGVFTDDIDIGRLTAAVLPILGVCELGNCPQTTGCGVLRGSARPRVGANVNLGSFYAVGMPVAVALAFLCGYDFKGLWLGLLAAQASCVLLMLAVISQTDWELQAKRARELTGGDESDDIEAKKDGFLCIVQDDEDEKTSCLVIDIKVEEPLTNYRFCSG